MSGARAYSFSPEVTGVDDEPGFSIWIPFSFPIVADEWYNKYHLCEESLVAGTS